MRWCAKVDDEEVQLVHERKEGSQHPEVGEEISQAEGLVRRIRWHGEGKVVGESDSTFVCVRGVRENLT